MASATPEDRLKARGILVAILLLAAAARFADLDWDDGHAFHPDERAIVFAVQRLSFSPLRLDPDFFAYGSLPLYGLRAATSVLGLFRPALGDDFASIVLIGRALSALAGVLTVAALYRLAAHMFGTAAGLLAAAFLACCPLHIQCSHFLATDVTLTLLVMLALHAYVVLAERGRLRDAVAAGALTGLALATKVSAAPLAIALLVAAGLPDRRRFASRAGLALLAAAAAFLLGQPYALFSFAEFWRQVAEQGGIVHHAGSVPYTIQYVGVPRYAYDAWQMVAWGMGPALGLASLWAAGRALWRLRTNRPAGALVLAGWVVPYVLVVGAFAVKYPRYLLPVYPVLLAWAADGLWNARHSRAGRVLLPAVTIGGVLSGLAFLAIYRGPHTSVVASEWVYANVPEGRTLLTQHWDEGFPLPSAGRTAARYRVIDFPFYEDDAPSKRDALAQALADADAVVLPTRRILGAVTRAPGRFPLTNRFYRLLFAGRLGFVLVHERTARPRLGALEVADELADESISVYDHPKVLVFLKGEALERGEIARRLEHEDAPGWTRRELLAFGRTTPGPLGLLHGREPVRQGALAVLWWVIVLEALGLAAYALLGPWLPRAGGAALARVFGVLLLVWPAWWAGHLIERSFTAETLGLLFVAVVCLGGWAWRRRGLRQPAEWASVGALFWGALFVFVLVRAGNPAVFWGEKPMDFAFLNTLTRASSLPPPEPWFAGSILHYTWFGHFAAAALGKLCGLHPGVTYNLAIATVGALTVSGAFALGAVAGRSRRVGLLAAVLVALCGNLAGPVELWWRRRGPFDAFWAVSRVVRDTINEYPLWSVFFADLHAHVLVLPFTLGYLALAVAQARSPRPSAPRMALLAVLLGAILVTNGWSGVTQPLLLPLLLALLIPAGLPRGLRTMAARVVVPTAVTWVGALIAFLPFWLAYRPPPRNWGWERHAFAAFHEYALVFGLFVAASLPLLLRGLTPARRYGALGVILVSAALSVARPSWGAWRVGMLVLAGLGIRAASRRDLDSRARTAAGLSGAGFLLTFVADLVFLWDRMNTVFKLYFEAWLLLAAGAAVALCLTWRSVTGRVGIAWRGAVAVLAACALVTGWQGAYAVVREPRVASPRPTLDGTAYLAERDPQEAAALEWLDAEVAGTPVIAEAWGEFYGEFARVSMNTGLPTILGWDYHVHQRAHEWAAIDARKADVSRLYRSDDASEVRGILDRYAVRYVYLGSLERLTYGPDAAPRLTGMHDVFRIVYRNPFVVILVVRPRAEGPR